MALPKRLLGAYQLLQELCLLSLAPLTYLLAPFVRSSPLGCRPRVLIVFTWIHKNPMHWFWRWYLERRGLPTAVLYIPLREVSLEESAEILRREMDGNDLRSVVLVGISTGALTCLSFLQRLGGWERVDGFVAVAGPFRGARSARFLSFMRNMRALLPSSPFIAGLGREVIMHPDRILCLSAAFDQLVPRASSQIPGARHEVIDIFGHNNLHVTAGSTYNRIAAWIERLP